MRTIEIKGKTFEVRFGLYQATQYDALAKREKGPDAPALVTVADADRGIDWMDLLILFFVSVRGQHGVHTLEAASAVFDDDTAAFSEMSVVLAQAVNDLFAGVEDGEPGKSGASPNGRSESLATAS